MYCDVSNGNSRCFCLFVYESFLWIRKLQLNENRDFSSIGRIKWGMLLGQLKRYYTNLIKYFFAMILSIIYME